jgi:hypothetical protein
LFTKLNSPYSRFCPFYFFWRASRILIFIMFYIYFNWFFLTILKKMSTFTQNLTLSSSGFLLIRLYYWSRWSNINYRSYFIFLWFLRIIFIIISDVISHWFTLLPFFHFNSCLLLFIWLCL